MRDNVRENLFEEGGAGESVRKGFNGNRGVLEMVEVNWIEG